MEDSIESKLPEVKKINTEMVARAKELALAITDKTTLDNAVEHGKEIDRRLKWWEDFIAPVVASAHTTWKMMTARREEVAAPLRQAKIALASAIAYYKHQENLKREAEQARLRAEQQKALDDAKLATASAMEKAGQKEEADAIINNTDEVLPPVVLPNNAETDGTHTRVTWEFSIVDETKIPREFLMPDARKIGGVVRSAKKDAERMIPGIEVREKRMEVFR